MKIFVFQWQTWQLYMDAIEILWGNVNRNLVYNSLVNLITGIPYYNFLVSMWKPKYTWARRTSPHSTEWGMKMLLCITVNLSLPQTAYKMLDGVLRSNFVTVCAATGLDYFLESQFYTMTTRCDQNLMNFLAKSGEREE